MAKKFCFDKKSINVFFVIKGILLLSLVLLPVRGYALEVGDRSPDFRAVTIKGEKISYYRDLKGKKPVYLVFWTTWCPYCKVELPQIEELYKKYGDRVEFIGVSLGIKNEINKFVREKKLSFPVVYDEGNRIAGAFGAQIQTNLLIDKQGVIVYKGKGFEEDIVKRLKKFSE